MNVSDVELDAGGEAEGNYADATLTIARDTGANSEDVLSFSDANGITLSEGNLVKNGAIIANFDTSSTTGKLEITFTDDQGVTPTSADVNNILSQITYANSSDAPATSVQLDWTFSDGNLDSQGNDAALLATGSSVVNITAVNDAPVITGDAIGSVTEDSATSTLTDSGTLSISDVDTGEAIFQTSGITTSTGTLGSLNITENGVWTYNVDNSAVQYLGENETKIETFTVLSADGTEQNITVTITGVNDMPELVVTDLAVNEDDNAITGTATFADADNNDIHTFTVSNIEEDSGNVVIDSATGTYIFTPGNNFQNLAEGETTTVTFDVTIDDGIGEKSTKTVTVTITGSNDTPTIDTATGSTQIENIAVSGNVVANFSASDIDNDDLSYQITSGNTDNYFVIDASTGVVTLNAAGEAALANDALTDAVYHLGVTVNDGTVDSEESTADILFDGINDAPAGAEFIRYLSQLTPLSQSNITGNAKFDTDYYGDKISLSGIDYDYGVITHAAKTDIATIDYNIDGATRFVATIGIEDSSGANGDVIFRVLVDGTEQYNSGQVNYVDDAIEILVDVTGGTVLQLEVSNADDNRFQDHAVWAGARLEGGTASSVSVNENTANDTVVGFVSGNDFDSPDSFTYSLTNNAGGRFAIDSTGKVTVANETLLDYETNSSHTIDVAVTDIEGATTTQTLTILVTDVNEVAVVTGTDTGSVKEDISVIDNNISVSGSLTIADPDAGESSFKAAIINGDYGDLNISAEGLWKYSADNTQAEIQQLAAGESITDTVTVNAFDGTSHDLLITIVGQDDLAIIDGVIIGNVVEDVTLTSTGTLIINDVDASDSTQFVDVAATKGDNGFGSFEMTENNWTYNLDNTHETVQALASGQILNDNFTFTAPDGVTQVITVVIAGRNDAPEIAQNSGLSFTTITEDMETDNIAGDLISEILASSNTNSNSISDADSGALEGIAIRALSSDNGYWQYDIGDGWVTIDSVSESESLLLAEDDRVRFVPSSDWFGTEFLSYVAWDQTSGLHGEKIDTAVERGENTAFSKGQVVASITVQGVNDAPTIEVIANDFIEDAGGLTAGVSIAGTYSTDKHGDGDQLTVTFNSASVHYTLDQINGHVLLTQEGIDVINLGGSLDNIDLKVIDNNAIPLSNSAVGIPVVTAVNDIESLSISNSVVTEDATLAGTVIGTYTLIDEEGGLSVDFSAGTNNDDHYELVNNEVHLTVAGAAYLHAGNSLANISLTTSDGVSATNTVSTKLVNDLPIIKVLSVTDFTEDATSNSVGSTVATFLTSDEEGDSVTVTLSDTTNYTSGTGTNVGKVLLTADGLALVNAGTKLPAFTVKPNDGSIDGIAGNVAPSVTAQNDLTVVANDSATTNEDAAIDIDVLANDDDSADGSDAAVSPVASVTQGTNGIVTINDNGTVKYTPNADFNGTDSFTYTNAEGQEATVNVTVDAVNDLTVVANDSATTNEDAAIDIDVLANDDDSADGSDAAVSPVASVTQGTNGIVTINDNGTVKYTPNADFNGTDSFTYTNAEGQEATVNVTVDAVNDLTVVANDSATTNEDAAIDIDVLANDDDSADGSDAAVSPVASVTQGTNGIVTINDNGTVKYTPNADFNGTDSFTYTNAEGQEATVNVTVDAVNDLTVVANDSATTNEDAAIDIDVLANDDDSADGSDAAVSPVASVTQGINGNVSINTDGTIKYIPNTNFNGSDSFTYTNEEGQVGTVNVTITKVNDVAVAFDDAVTTDENSILNSSVPVASDVDGTVVSYQLLDNVKMGELNFNEDGSYTFNPNTDFDDLAVNTSRDVIFTYTATDNENGVSEIKTITITVTGSNDLPIIDSIKGSTQVENSVAKGDLVAIFGASDLDGDTVMYSLTSGNDSGYFEIDTNTGNVTLTAVGQAAIENDTLNLGNQVIGVTASDGINTSSEANATIVISHVNDNAPTIDTNLGSTQIENTAVAGDIVATFTASDLDASDAVTFSISSGNTNNYFEIA